MIDFDNLTFIPIEDIPKIVRGKWVRLFSKLPKGKAYKIDDEKLGRRANGALVQLKRRGKFNEFYATRRDGKMYIVNPIPQGYTPKLEKENRGNE